MMASEFAVRLATLRIRLDVSARQMSMDMGLAPGYISAIENGRAQPSMRLFFEICDYLNVTPMDFFNTEAPYPADIERLARKLQLLDAESLTILEAVIDKMIGKA